MPKHHNILYAVVFILLVLNIVTFISLSSRLTTLDSRINEVQEDSRAEMTNLTLSLTDAIRFSDESNRKNFGEISEYISGISKNLSNINANQQSVSDKIKGLESLQGDFSVVIDEAVKGIVTIRTESSLGTGFFINDRGYLVTNQHVIEGAKKISVLGYDKRLVSAELVGSDNVKDVALLRIENNYPYLSLADSDNLKVGNKVIAIGNPLGLSYTVTEGIISANHRVGPTNLPEYIQTDVSLNPGNSGGPLIDTNGRVVGMNNFKLGNAESIGFALESNSLKEAVLIISNGSIELN